MTIVQDMLPAVTDLAASIGWLDVLRIALLIIAAICILGSVLRLAFGKGSSLVRSVSACINLLMIYLAVIILYVLLPSVRSSLTSLPFITVTADALYLWDVAHLDTTLLYPALLELFILAFLVNLMESVLPQGKKFWSWYGFRLLTVVCALGLYSVMSALICSFAPQIFGTWAGYILLGLWAFIALTGLAKVLFAVVLTAVNPIIGGIYTFFFSHIFGKQFSKAILTTLLSVGILALLYHLGFTAFAFSGFSLAAYGPVCVIAVLALYLFGKLL